MLILKVVKILNSSEKTSAKNNVFKIHRVLVDDSKIVDGTVFPGTKLLWLSSSKDFEFRNEGTNFVFVNQSKSGGNGFWIQMMAI